MKTISIFLLQLFLISATYGQDSVYGIKFGIAKENAKIILQKRVGEYNVNDNGDKLSIYNQTFAGVKFDILDFEFSWFNGSGCFNSASFQKNFPLDDMSNAKQCRDFIFERFKRKYEYYEQEQNKDGFLRYKFGLNPNDSSKVTGMIDLIRGKGVDGIERLYLYVIYFPFVEDWDLNDL